MELEKKLLDAMISIIVILAHDFKDGVQATDFITIATKINENAELKKELLEVYNNIDQIKADAKDFKVKDGVELVTFLIPKIMEVYQAIKA